MVHILSTPSAHLRPCPLPSTPTLTLSALLQAHSDMCTCNDAQLCYTYDWIITGLISDEHQLYTPCLFV